MVAMTERRPDSQQLTRQWAMLRLLSEAKRPYAVKDLAEQLKVSKATIERDLATFARDFALVEESAGKQKKVYRIDEKIRALESISFAISELLAIYASLASFASMTGTPLHDDLHEVLQKIRGFLAPHHNGGLDALSRVFAPHVRGHVDYAPHGEHIDQLADAIARRRVCTVEYHAAWKGTTRTHRIRPLKIVAHASMLYLLACVGEHERITTLAVHRIRDLKTSDEPFEVPRLDIESHIAKAFGIFVSDAEEDVEVLFDAEIAWRIEERTFHPAEIKERLSDGTLRYRLRSSAQWEIVPWVQSYGARAELVAPNSWRDVVKKNAELTLARYTQRT
jgi:predicted DNA-binding transcriptional regulator YafY